jgi:hypothetical protein
MAMIKDPATRAKAVAIAITEVEPSFMIISILLSTIKVNWRSFAEAGKLYSIKGGSKFSKCR